MIISHLIESIFLQTTDKMKPIKKSLQIFQKVPKIHFEGMTCG